MYTLGIPKRDYRRATQVLSYESQPSIPYHETLQDDGFYMFTFPEVGSEDDFRDVVVKLKGEGIRVIGADAQLTERQIMKLVDLVPLKEESTGAFGATSEELADMYSLKMLQQFRDEVMMDMKQKDGPIADMYRGQLNGLDKAITIKKGEINEGTCGYSVDGKLANKPAGPHLIRKAIRKEIKSLHEQRENRYVVTMDMYVYGKDDYMARVEAHKLVDELKKKYDNQAAVLEIHEQPFGSLSSRKLKDISKPMGRDEKEEDLPFE